MEWTKYTTKETLKDNDELMILDKDANANKRTLMDKIWDYVVDKMTTAVIAKLETTNKTLIGAVNELNSNTILRYGINGVSNGSKNTIINLSNLEKNRHYLVILACGHVQDDYCITAIGHAYRDIKYIAFSLNEIFSDNAFGIAWKQNGLNVTITTKSSGNIAPQGTLVFI